MKAVILFAAVLMACGIAYVAHVTHRSPADVTLRDVSNVAQEHVEVKDGSVTFKASK